MNETIPHEQILLEGLKEGNVKIFDYLFHYYYSGLVVFCFRYINDMEDAEDLVQDFFFHLWVNRKRLDITHSIRSYFFSSIKNKSLDYLKHKKVERKAEDELIYSQAKSVQQPNFLVESELDEQIREALNKLPEKCRKVFLMNRFEGIKPVEIAQKENISVRTVEGHIGKAIKILRTELTPHIPAFLVMILTGSS